MGRSDDECRVLENVGKEIVSKCKGLPLAAKTMGSLLRFKRTRKEWENILNSGMWELEEFEKGIFPPLLLSYNDLPLMVKRCFSYCVIFPKDYQLHKDELIKLWMAQGYLGLEQKREMEMIGENYFNILATRSFFQEFIKDNIGDIVGCKMHDIVHDFGQFLTKNECFAMKDNDFGDSSINFSFEKAHHLILMVDNNSSFPISICNIKNLRSLLFQFEEGMNSFDGVLLELLGQNTCLRALAMGGTAKFDMMTSWRYLYPIKLERIPKEIRKLIHLRYLDLSKNDALEMLPEELCELCNLQTLNVLGCVNLKELPQGMGKLINLRHLVNESTPSLRYMPKGIEKLTCLQTLSEFRVSGSDYRTKACSLEFLNQFGRLEGSLGIKGLGNVTNRSEAQRIQLRNKENILKLELGFGGSNSVNTEAIIEALQPPPNLQRLIISKYVGNTVLPNWITSLTNFRSISLFEWINCEQLPPLGKVSSLESIVIQRMNRVKRVGIEILGLESDGITLSSSSLSVSAFPKLKSLYFYRMGKSGILGLKMII